MQKYLFINRFRHAFRHNQNRAHHAAEKRRFDSLAAVSYTHLDVYKRQIDILAVQKHLPRDAAALNQIIHTVQALEQSGFAAAGGPDECRNFLFRQLQIDVFQRMKIAII